MFKEFYALRHRMHFIRSSFMCIYVEYMGVFKTNDHFIRLFFMPYRLNAFYVYCHREM